MVGNHGATEIKIVGILEPTGTIIDKYHLVSQETFDNIPFQENIKVTY